MKLKVIRNLTATTQSCVLDGQQVLLQPREEKVVSEQTAKAFLHHCSPYVKEVQPEEFGGVAIEKTGMEDIWLANMTGNPDASDTIPTKMFSEKRWKDTTCGNPKKAALVISREFDGGMRPYKNGPYEEALNLPSTTISLPPYSRKKFPKNIATWFLARDGVQEPGMRGAAIRSRAPSSFEPTIDWELDDMRLYLQLCDHKAVLGPTREELLRKAVADNVPSDVPIYEAKLLAMRRLHFRLADPNVRLPSKGEFDEMKQVLEEQTKQARQAKKVA